ncbi:MAG: FKBP-type peptidyl-prolyl cis-trans isomerase [Bacteroidales bacterium]|nr:FKBP-type peptidyl-prolyl cis-trans isomerase [Bacteroidales bacterium]
MKKIFLSISILITLVAFCSCGERSGKTAGDVKLNNFNDTLAWVLGEQLGKSLVMTSQVNSLDIDMKVAEQAFASALEGKESQLDDKTSAMVMQVFQMGASQNAQRRQEQNEVAMSNDESNYFANLVKTNNKVKKHESGIYYEVVKQGKGPKARFGDVVRFDYRGYNMITGELFDQTYGQRDPINHVLGKPMFAGLIEGMQLMNAGSLYRLYVPSALAFGANGTQNIPPYTPVIYEIELHAINPE